jgi:ABC-type nickel/cobalt efflux system permease component RcnA
VILLVAIFGGAHKRRNGCDDPAWITFSTSGFVLAIIFCIAAWAIQRRFRSTKMSRNLGRDRRRWHIVILAAVNMLSFTVQFSDDVYYAAHGDEGCGSIYTDPSNWQTFVYISSRIVFLLLPILAVLHCFRDIPSSNRDSVHPAHSVGRGAQHLIAGVSTAPLVIAAGGAHDTRHQGHGAAGAGGGASFYATGSSVGSLPPIAGQSYSSGAAAGLHRSTSNFAQQQHQHQHQQHQQQHQQHQQQQQQAPASPRFFVPPVVPNSPDRGGE